MQGGTIGQATNFVKLLSLTDRKGQRNQRGTTRAYNKNIENHWQLFCFFNSFNSFKHRRILARIRDSNVPR